MNRLFSLSLLSLVACEATFAQVNVPESAQANLYFPHLADGGPAIQQWQTILTFVNTNPTPAAVTIFFYRDDGGPLNIDFGNGPISQFSFTVPAGGSRIYRSRIASSSTAIGWALASASLPVQGTVAFRQLVNGKSQVEITSNSTLPTIQYVSAANRALGIALGNRFSNVSVLVDVQVKDADGNVAGQQSVSVPPLGHTSFNLYQLFPSLSTSFSGSVLLTGATPQKDTFVAWTLNADAESGDLTSLPEGRVSSPVSQYDRIWRAFTRVLASAQRNIAGFGTQPVNLTISYDPVINASASGNSITIYRALAELISDSESELGFAIAHELGHVYQFRVGHTTANANPEFDADIFGLAVSLGAGYDPYAAAGTLAKLAMVSGQAGLVTQFEAQTSGEVHESFNQRLSNVFTFIQQTCASVPAACADYKMVYHPDFPAVAPLSKTGVPVQ